MRSGFPVLLMVLILAAFGATVASAMIEVDITSIDPSDGQLDDNVVDTLTVYWEIDVDDGESGDYRVEIDGDGTPESGELVKDEDGEGSFNGSKSGSTVVSVSKDLDNGDGDYTVYVIATDEDTEDSSADSVTINLDNVPYAPTGLSVGTGDAKLFLDWDEHDDRDITNYFVYYATHPGETADDYDGTGIDQGDSPLDAQDADELIVTGLDNNTTYYFRLQVIDENDNESELSEEKSGTPAIVSGLADLSGEDGSCGMVGRHGAYLIPLAAIVLALVLIRIGRSRRGVRAGRAILPVLLLAVLLIPRGAAEAEDTSPIHFSLNLHAGFMLVDEPDFEDVYNQNWMGVYGLQFGYKLVKDLELSLSASYGFKDGDGVTASGNSTDEAYRLQVVPGTLSLLYRLRFVAEQPVVPYLGAGGAGVFFHESRVEEPDINTSGMHYGYTGFAGVQFLLDKLDQRAAAHMDLDFGINNSYVYYEYRYQSRDDFGDDKGILDLTSQVHEIGLMFEF